MSESGKRISVMIGLALALIPLLLFAYFGLSTRLMGDDYANVGLPMQIGAWETMQFWRTVWNGGYSSFLLWGLLAPLGTAAPALFSFAVIASLFVAYSWMANAALAQLCQLPYRRPLAAVLASLMVAATLNAFYSPHTLYWYASGVTYVAPVVMLLLGIALAVEIGRRLRGSIQQLLAAIATALFAFVNAGFSELHLVFQLAAVALINLYVFFSPAGSRRKPYQILAAAAFLGTAASLPVQVSAPGFAVRSSVKVQGSLLELPLQDLFVLSDRALNETLTYAGHPESFAGFMLVAFAGLFVALSASSPVQANADLPRIRATHAPLAFALLVQLLFLPILWSHQSDNLQILGKFSYPFMLVVCMNLCAILVLLALIWRRRLHRLLQRRNGLMIYCGCILLAACLLFLMTQARSIHVKASSYLFFTTVTLLLMLARQFARIADEPGLNRLFLLTLCLTAAAIIALAFVVSVEIFLVRFVNRRSISAAVFALMLAGLLNGLTLGALIRHGFCLTGAATAGLRGIRLLCLLVALTIAAGIVFGQGRRIGYVREYVDIWESQHQEIIRLRDAGDPAVFTLELKRIVAGKMDHQPPPYYFAPLDWMEKVFYGLDGTRYYE